MTVYFKRSLSITFAVISLFAEVYATAKAGTEQGFEERDVEASCVRTANAYFLALDAGDADAVAGLFAEDADLILPDKVLKGRDKIRAHFSVRPEGRLLLHHLTTHHVSVTDDGSVSGVVYALINVLQESDGKKNSAIVSGVYRDDYKLDNGECKIAARSLKRKVIHITGQPQTLK